MADPSPSYLGLVATLGSRALGLVAMFGSRSRCGSGMIARPKLRGVDNPCAHVLWTKKKSIIDLHSGFFKF